MKEHQHFGFPNCNSVFFLITTLLSGVRCTIRQLIIIALLIVILLAGSFSINPAAKAQEPSFYWQSYNIEIDVQENGDILVTETQKCFFNAAQNGGYRFIPVDRLEKIDSIEVSTDGERLPVRSRLDNNQLWIVWDYPIEADQAYTFVLKYRIIGSLLINDQGDSIFWRAFFEYRDALINSSKVIITLPLSLDERSLEITSSGVEAESRMIDSRTIEFIPSEILTPGKWLDVRVTFPHGIIDAVVPVWQQQVSKDREVIIPESSLSMGGEMSEEAPLLEENETIEGPPLTEENETIGEPPLPPKPAEAQIVRFMRKWWYAGVIIGCIVIIALLGRRFVIRKRAG